MPLPHDRDHSERPQRATRRGRRLLAVTLALGLTAAGITWASAATSRPTASDPIAQPPMVVTDSIASSQSGPTRRVAGVPVGFAPTRQGAADAAAAYARVLSARWFLTGPDHRLRRRAVEVMAAPEVAANLQATQDQLARRVATSPFGKGLGRRGVRSVLMTAHLGYRVDAFTPPAAEVALWSVVLYGNDGGLAPQALWTTSRLRLRWVGGDWKLQDISTTPGPIPVHGDAAPSLPRDFVAAAGTFTELSDVAE